MSDFDVNPELKRFDPRNCEPLLAIPYIVTAASLPKMIERTNDVEMLEAQDAMWNIAKNLDNLPVKEQKIFFSQIRLLLNNMKACTRWAGEQLDKMEADLDSSK